MKDLIKKILREETEELDWMKSINPLESFEDYFYGENEYKNNRKNSPGIYIKRDISWWRGWIEESMDAHESILMEVEELNEMVNDLVNPQNGSEKYSILADDVYAYTSPMRALNGKNIIQSSAAQIYDAYNTLGTFAEDNDLNILEALTIFKNWLDKKEKEGRPLHIDDGTGFNID